jgi:glutamine amidotransferase
MIAVIDYGMGNLRSVQKALQNVGGDARLVTGGVELARADKIVFPGVAAFGDAMEQLRRQGLIDPVRKAVAAGTPYLGFCLGLQLLFEVGYEDGEHRGLGLLGGKVVRFDLPPTADGRRLSVPHMGWNQIRWSGSHRLAEGIADGSFVYFAHSYHVVPDDERTIAARTEYGYGFASAVASGAIFATQFHPEKSQSIGLTLLRNFVSL